MLTRLIDMSTESTMHEQLAHRQRSTSTAVSPEDLCVEELYRLSLGEGCIERHIFVSDLPLELILYILSLLPCRSAIKLVLSQRTLYNTFFFEEGFYRSLCDRFCPSSLSSFHPARTFRSVYTGLLHKYGPLLGHWASDRPFRGNVMEFRVVDFNQVGWEGIVCEVWKFPRPRLAQLLGAEDRGVTLPPDFYESFRIVMPPLSRGDSKAPHSPVGSHDDIDSCHASKIFWTLHSENLDWSLDEHDRPSLHLLGPTTQSFYVHEQPTHIRDYDIVTGPSEPSLHPEIPLPVWYDEMRGLPNLPQETMPLYDNSFLAHKYSNGVFLFGAPSRTDLEKPPALAVFPPLEHIDRLQLHDPPFVGVGDARHVDRSSEGYISYSRDRGIRLHARYYPMIFPKIPEATLSVEPDQEIWKLESLIGLWYGAYEVYGSEVLFLDWNAITNEVKAWKVTGDINVPRGAVSWSFQTSARVELDDHAWEVFSQLGDISRDVRAYRGIGVVGGRGYIPNQRDTRPITVAIVGIHEIRVRWGEMQHTMQCKRCRPRVHATETSVHNAPILRSARNNP